MKKSLKLLAIITAATLLLTSFVGCKLQEETNKEESTPTESNVTPTTSASKVPEKFEKLVVLFPGDESKGFEEFIKGEYGQKIKEELNMELDYSFAPWSNYGEKYNLMLNSGERLDWLWHGLSSTSSLMAKGLIMPIDELLKEYGQDILITNPMENHKSAEINGKLYAITLNAPRADSFYTINVRQDLLVALGMNSIESMEDLDKFQALVKEKYPEMTANSGNISPQMMSRVEEGHINWIRFGLRYNFYVDDKTNDDKVYSYFESEAFKNASNKAKEWYLKGYLPEDTLVNRISSARMNTGKAAWDIGAITADMERMPALKNDVPEGVYKEYSINPSKPRYILASAGNVHFIPSTAKAPERAMMWINWIYKSQENYDFHVLGVKGKHYDLVGESPKALDGEQRFYEWMWRNINFMRFPDYVDSGYAQKLQNWDKEAKFSKIYGFTFDDSNLTSEIAQVNTVITQYFEPMQYGLISYDEYYEKAIDELKKAGNDKIHEELQKQFSEWKAKQ